MPAISNILRKVLRKLARFDRPSRVVLGAGLVAVLYAPALAVARSLGLRPAESLRLAEKAAWSTAAVDNVDNIDNIETLKPRSSQTGIRQAAKNLLAISTLVAVLVSYATAVQLQCMITGDCRITAWILSGIFVLACAAYMVFVTRSLGSNGDLSAVHPRLQAPGYASASSFYQYSGLGK